MSAKPFKVVYARVDPNVADETNRIAKAAKAGIGTIKEKTVEEILRLGNAAYVQQNPQYANDTKRSTDGRTVRRSK